MFVHAGEMVSRPDRGAKNNERHACGRRRDGEAAVSEMLILLLVVDAAEVVGRRISVRRAFPLEEVI